MKFSLTAEEQWVEHPNHSELSVLVRRLTRKETLELFSELNDAQVPVALRDPATGGTVRDYRGQVAYATIQKFPFKTILQVLEKTVKDWKGFQDKDGSEIPFNAKHLDILFDPRLMCTIENPNYGKLIDPENPDLGVDKDKTYEQPFWRYISDKTAQNEVFEADPKTIS